MYSYLENFLGETARAIWESYKLNCPTDFQQDISLGVNPYNFTNRMKIMILGSNPNMGFNAQQKEAIRKLEIIQIKNWKYIKPFLQDFLYYTCKAGAYHDQALGERLFLKLPAPIGHEIHQAWNNDPEKTTLALALNNITARIQFIIDRLVERCTRLKGDRHLKGEFSFCNELYTPQTYDIDF